MAEAVIFDMDGVLVNSEPYHFRVEKLILEKMGIEITDEEIHGFVGLAIDKMWERLRERYSIGKQVSQLVEEDTVFRVSYFRNSGPIPPIDGVVPLLDSLSGAGFIKALASSSHPDLIKALLEATGLEKYFTVCLSGFQVRHGKPEPDIFIETASTLGIDCGECVVIEDSFNGVTAAKKAGMKCIGFSNPFSGSQDLSMADIVVDSFSLITLSLIAEM